MFSLLIRMKKMIYLKLLINFKSFLSKKFKGNEWCLKNIVNIFH